MFRRNDSFHFANMSRTMITLYRFETLQSWEAVLYINMFGCDRVGYGVNWGSSALGIVRLLLASREHLIETRRPPPPPPPPPTPPPPPLPSALTLHP